MTALAKYDAARMRRAADALIRARIDREPIDGPVFLYVIGRKQGPVKVGITHALTTRLLTLQTGCPYKIEILHSVGMRDRAHALQHERNFHTGHSLWRLAGEWFDCKPEQAVHSIEVHLALEAWEAQA